MIDLPRTLLAAQESPSVALGAVLVLGGGLLCVPALSAARWLAPPPRALDARWTPVDVVVVFAVLVFGSRLVQLLLPGTGILPQIERSQALFAAAGGTCLVLARRRVPGLAALGLAAPPRVRSLLAGLVGYAPLLPLLLGVGILWALLCRELGWEVGQETLRSIAELEGRELGLALVIAILPGPFLEELLFRGFLQGALSQLRGEGAGVAAGALLFALLHGSSSAFIPLFLLSLFLGWLQVRTRSLFAPWAVHALHNAITLALALAPVPG